MRERELEQIHSRRIIRGLDQEGVCTRFSAPARKFEDVWQRTGWHVGCSLSAPEVVLMTGGVHLVASLSIFYRLEGDFYMHSGKVFGVKHYCTL